jgi:hypothetical protein
MFSTSRANRVASAESALIVRPLSNSNRRCCGMLGDRPARGWIDWGRHRRRGENKWRFRCQSVSRGMTRDRRELTFLTNCLRVDLYS